MLKAINNYKNNTVLHSITYDAVTNTHLIKIYFTFTVNWSMKAKRRHTTGTGRMRHLKLVNRRFQ